jgi:hypothetical protein
VSAPVRPISITTDLRDLPPAPRWEPGDAIRDVPLRERPRPLLAPRAVAPPDPLLSRSLGPVPPPGGFGTPLFNFDGQGFTGTNPPDTNMDVGPAHVIQIVNHAGGTSVLVMDKSGLPVTFPFLMDTLAGGTAPCSDGFGDPVVVYDTLADRWLLAEFARMPNSVLCVYMSKTNDPVTGGWWLYAFPTPEFPDYPKYSVWPDAYYVTTNESGPASYALDRERMLAGQPATYQRFLISDMPGFFTQALAAADVDGHEPPPPGAPAVFMRHRDDEVHDVAPDPTRDFLEMFEFHVDWADPGQSSFTGPTRIAVAEFSSELCTTFGRMCFPEPSGLQLDSMREMMMHRLQYRSFGAYETLTGNFVVDADGEPDPLPDPDSERGGVRWYQLRRQGGGPWTLFDEGTHSPDPTPRWMASVALDGSGNLAVGYTAASRTVFPGIRYTGRLAADPPGTLRAEVPLVDGTTNNGSTRWGDYAAMSVDPVDDCTFWFTTLYSPAPQWRTRIGAFAFDECVRVNTAAFDPPLQAPACASPGRGCDSGALLAGRDTMAGGAEPNQPNTVAGSCADGTAGQFHVRESVDHLRVQTVDGTAMAAGKTVRVEVGLWAYGHGLSPDTLEVFAAADATSPAWTRIGSLRPPRGGQQTATFTYTLPAGPLQAVRARLRYLGEPGPCGRGRYDDHDDLVFAVQ